MSADWRSHKERSTPFMLRLIVWFAAHCPRGLMRWVLYPTVLYFVLSSAASRRYSTDYLQRVLNRKVSWRDHWRHFMAFATCTLDRIYFLGSRASDLQVVRHRPADVAALANSGQGCMLFVAHFGSAEAMRVMGTNQAQLPISILLDRQVGRMLMSLLEQLNPEIARNVIDAADRGPQLVLNLKEALERGRMIGIMADRALATERAVSVDFLGGKARLPVGPWQLAATLKVPVILGFACYEGSNRYSVYLEMFDDKIELPRQQRDAAIAAYAQRYAQRLEHFTRLAPYNWFNFFDYWQTASHHETATH
jgi:predicted LPLAT superfamily acyltransferase